jgi:hypothetical protein
MQIFGMTLALFRYPDHTANNKLQKYQCIQHSSSDMADTDMTTVLVLPIK